jgi:hypothetical protein
MVSMLSVKDSISIPDLDQEIKYHLDEWQYYIDQATLAQSEYMHMRLKAEEHRSYYFELKKLSVEASHV